MTRARAGSARGRSARGDSFLTDCYHRPFGINDSHARAAGSEGLGMSHLTYGEAGVVGLIQGITELFPLSSLGHNVLIPALIGGSWAKDLNVSAPESPYLAIIVGLHVATALAMIVFFWRDWVRIIAAFFASLRHVAAPEPGTNRFEPQNTDQMLAWMIILATIPVGIAGARA